MAPGRCAVLPSDGSGGCLMRFRTMSDSELVALASKGSRVAFDELDARHRERVYGQCLGIMREHELALDCVQDTLMKAYVALPGFRRDARFSTWLYVIARNVCFMRLRKKMLTVVPLERSIESTDGTVECEITDPSADASAGVMRDELRAIIGDRIRKLTPSARRVLELRLLHGLSTRGTAETLGLSEAAVKSRLHRARSMLRDGLSASGYDTGSLA
jgi:RNA polymerase sigma-70 factor (ECF subfamily)